MRKLPESICWGCKNAVPGNGKGCRWSVYLKPVDGWKATPTEHKCVRKTTKGFCVLECPEFEKG